MISSHTEPKAGRITAGGGNPEWCEVKEPHPHECDQTTDPSTMTRRYRERCETIKATLLENTQMDGKVIRRIEHDDGRRSVNIEVTKLDVQPKDAEEARAKEVIEKEVLPHMGEALAKVLVHVVVIHKPTNEHASFPSPLPEVRKRAREVVEQHHMRRSKEAELRLSDYVVVEVSLGEEHTTRVSSLVTDTL